MRRFMNFPGWLVMAAAFISGITACNTIEEPAPTTTKTPKIYTLTVTASKGYDATRALSIDGKTLNATWRAGEVVSVYSVKGEGSAEEESDGPVGTLTAQGSGVTTTLKGGFIEGYTPTSGAKLRLKFNDKPDYTTQGGTLAYIAANCDNAEADVTISEVGTDGDVTTTAASFENQQAIVKFSLTRQDGTTPVEATSLTVSVGSMMYNVTLTTPASEIFVAIQNASNKTVSLSANGTSGHFTYDKIGVTFETGKYYAIGVKMTRQQSLGDLYYSDGTSSETLEAGKTPIGVIAYLGTDAFTENGVTLRDGTTTLQSHGLVLCLRNIAYMQQWKKRASEGGPANVANFSSDAFVNDRGDLFRDTYVSGYTNTKLLVNEDNPESNYPAAYQAWNYSELDAPTTTTGWFMPTIQQWVKMLTGLGGLNESDIEWTEWKDLSLTSIHTLEEAMAKAGEYDHMSDANRNYWSSSESTGVAATTLLIRPTNPNNQQEQGLTISFHSKENSFYVRPVLAF